MVLSDATQSASRFDDTSKIVEKTSMASIGIIAPSCATFSVYHVLIDYSFCGAITMIHDDRNGHFWEQLRWQAIVCVKSPS